MKTIQIEGIIEYDDYDGSFIYLIDGDNRIDLVNEFESTTDEYGKEVQVSYWITEKPCTKDEMLEKWLRKIFGATEAEYEDYYTGSWTYGSQSSYGEYEKRGHLKVGGHDLFEELQECNGKFIIIELTFKL